VDLGSLVGANRLVVETRIPRLASCLSPDLATALGRQGVVVVAQRCAPVSDLRRFITSRHHVVDVNGWPELRTLPASYEGLCW
jgi:hypothetical protein